MEPQRRGVFSEIERSKKTPYIASNIGLLVGLISVENHKGHIRCGDRVDKLERKLLK